MAPFTMPVLVAVQSMAARIGACQEQGLGQVIEDRYGRKTLIGSVTILLIANVVTIAADLGGIAAGVHLLVPVPVALVIPVVGSGLLAIEIFYSYRRFASLVKWVTLVLFLYIISGFAARPAWGEVVRGTFVPHLSLSRDFLSSAVAILGTTISPYMFFWITSQEVEEEEGNAGPDLDDDPVTAPAAEHKRRIDVITGMAYANLVFYFIILSNAATLGAHHIKIQTAAQAAGALTPIVGHFDTILFAVGLIGAGLIAVPVLAGAAAYPGARGPYVRRQQQRRRAAAAARAPGRPSHSGPCPRSGAIYLPQSPAAGLEGRAAANPRRRIHRPDRAFRLRQDDPGGRAARPAGTPGG